MDSVSKVPAHLCIDVFFSTVVGMLACECQSETRYVIVPCCGACFEGYLLVKLEGSASKDVAVVCWYKIHLKVIRYYICLIFFLTEHICTSSSSGYIGGFLSFSR